MAKPKPGKYDHVVKTLQPVPKDAPRQERINAIKDALFNGLGATQLAEAYVKLRVGATGESLTYALERASVDADRTLTYEEELQALVTWLGKEGFARLEKALSLRMEALVQKVLDSQNAGEDAWGKYGMKDNALRLESGATIRVESRPLGQVVDKEAFRLWCIANGYEAKLQLHQSTMNSLVKERCAAGEAYPDGTTAFRDDVVKLIKADGSGEEDE